MDHDSKAVANVFFKLARREGRRLTSVEYQRLVGQAHSLCLNVLKEPLVRDRVCEYTFGPMVPVLLQAFKEYDDGPVTRRLLTDTPPIKEDDPAFKVIRAAWTQFLTETTSPITQVAASP